MTRLLQAVSSSSLLRFPVRVQYAGESGVPDFQLESAGRPIGVELSKIAVQDVEHLRSLQRKEIKQTSGISSLYRKQEKPRTKDEVIDEGFLTPVMVFPVSVEEYNAIWLEAVTAELDDKTTVLRGSHFYHGSEDWLTLWDRIGTSESEIEARIESVSCTLASRWKPDWYSRVFLQDEHFHWLVMFTSLGYVFHDARKLGA